MADIFLSYAREDLTNAKMVAQALEAAGLSVWWDRRLLAGQQFSSEIEREIDAAGSVVVLWSQMASQSRWVRDEASAGADQNKLCPVLIDSSSIPLGFRQFHTIDLREWRGEAHEPQIHALISQLQKGTPRTQITKPSIKAGDPVLAVLPFDNLSADEELRYFSDGISDEILTRLLHGSSVRLMGRASSFRYRGERKGAAGKELACTHLLDGAIRRAGNRVRTTAYLLEIASDQVVWSDRYDDDLEDILDTQDRISEAIADALDSEFSRRQRRDVPADVYDRYLKAKLDSWALETLPASINGLQKITAEAPQFADAWAQLAMWSNYYSYLVPRDQAERFRTIARRAVMACEELQYAGVEPLISQFRFLPPFGAFLEAAPIISRMQVASANGPAGQGILSMHFADLGMIGRCIKHAMLGYELDPDDLLAATMFVVSPYYAGDTERACELMKDSLSRNPANYHVVMALLSCAVVNEDKETLGRFLDPNRLQSRPMHEYSRFIAVFRATESGDPAAIRAAAIRLASNAESLGAVDVISLSFIGKLIGADHAYDLLERVRIGLPKRSDAETGPSLYGTSPLFVDGMPEIREDPRFPRLAARLGLAQYWAQTDYWPDCSEHLERLYDFKKGCIDAARTIAIDSFFPPRK